MFRFVLPLIACFLAGSSASAMSVRVQQTPGGPQTHVDGKPVPPRFFWGSMNSGRIAATPEWTAHSFEFRPGIEVAGTGTLHFRFSQAPGEIRIADVRIQDAQTGENVLATYADGSPAVAVRRRDRGWMFSWAYRN